MQLELPRSGRSAIVGLLPRVALSERALAAVATIVLTAGVLAVYVSTLAPTVMWYDMGQFATASATLGIAHNTGYPLLILLGKAFTFIPVGDTAYRVNLLSAVCTALAVAVVFSLIRDLTRDVTAAGVGALSLAFTSTVWANATWATSYGLNLLFTAAIIKLMLAWRREPRRETLVLAALLLGLALCNHRLIVLVVPPAFLVLAASRSALDRRTAALAAVAFAAGLSVYLYLPIRGEQQPALSWAHPAEWRTYWSMFLNGQTPSGYWRWDIADRLDVLWAYPSYDFTVAGLALAALGFAVCARRDAVVAAAFALLIAGDAAIVLTYSIHNVYNYLTPAYVVLAVLIGAGAAWCMQTATRLPARWLPVRPSLRCVAVAAILALLPAALIGRHQSNVDRSNNYAAYDFARTTLQRLPAAAVVMTDSWTASPLWYAQLVDGQRRDVLVSPIFSVPGEDPAAFARTQINGGRRVYLADGLRTSVAALEADFIVQPVLLNGIELMLVDSLPKPEYRDDLVPFGSLYRVTAEAPDVTVARAPSGAARDVPFGDVTLLGFATNVVAVRAGSVAEITYYWRPDRRLEADLTAVTTFTDASGVTPERYGRPRWWQSREIGQGVLTTSEWQYGDIVRESYFTLVPRDTAPGAYNVRITVFDASLPSSATSERAVVGKITVLAPE